MNYLKENQLVLIVGLGSIGVRHCNNLVKLGIENISVVTSKKELPDQFKNCKRFTSIEEAGRNEIYTHAIVCSPTAHHLQDLSKLISLNIPQIYLEKPISNTLEEVNLGLNYLSKNNRIVVGYDLRFDPGLNKVKSLLENQAIGKVYSANAFVGQYLPDWRPHEDYRIGMSASIEKGGGVMLDLIHEFDYLTWLMGRAEMISAIYQENKEFEIETEDVADVLIKFESGSTGTIHLDYHQRVLIRNCVITGALGTIKWDLAVRKVILIKHNKENIEYDFTGFERNDRYLEIVKAFVEGVRDDRICTFDQGLESLQLVVASKQSSQSNSIIKLPIYS